MKEIRCMFDDKSIAFIDELNMYLQKICKGLRIGITPTRKDVVRFLVKLVERQYKLGIPQSSETGIVSALFDIAKKE